MHTTDGETSNGTFMPVSNQMLIDIPKSAVPLTGGRKATSKSGPHEGMSDARSANVHEGLDKLRTGGR
jgi:hypothetical protein